MIKPPLQLCSIMPGDFDVIPGNPLTLAGGTTYHILTEDGGTISTEDGNELTYNGS